MNPKEIAEEFPENIQASEINKMLSDKNIIISNETLNQILEFGKSKKCLKSSLEFLNGQLKTSMPVGHLWFR